MNDPSIRNPAYQQLNDQQLSEIDELCDRFDQELVRGLGPRMEKFLADAPMAARNGLLAELLVMELEYRAQQRDEPQIDEYHERFPEQAHVIAGAFSQHAQAGQFLETPEAASRSATEKKSLSESADDLDLQGERASSEAAFRRYLKPATRDGWLGRLGHYEIEKILGRGAFGIVAKAFDKKLHRVVAIKLMDPELAATSPPRKRFLREARTAAAVTHESIVAVHAVEEEPIPYLAMEYIAGQTLEQRMNNKGPLDVADVLRIGQQVAAGLAAAHSVHLIHRDIKPSNILLTDGVVEKAKISDFGLARAVDDASMTSSGLIAGTPMYMAPEQARGETLDHRADLFSLGSVLYQMVAGRPPFRAANTVAVLKRVCEDTPRSLDDVIPTTPDWLQSIIFRLLEKDRQDRFQSAQEVADLLARCQRELEHGGKVISVATPRSAKPSGNTRNKMTKSAWPKRLLMGVLVALAVLVLTILGPRLARWFDTPIPTLPQAVTIGGMDGDSSEKPPLNGDAAIVSPAVAEDEADVAILFLEGNRRRHDSPHHGVEVHVDIKDGEQIIQHARRMDFDFLKRNNLVDPFFARGWWKNSDTEWSDVRAIHFQSGIDSKDAIWGVSTNRANSAIGSIIIATGSEDKHPFFEAESVRVEPYGQGKLIKVSTNDQEAELGVADGSIYLSDRGWLELCWMGEKESLINSHKTYYLPSGTTLHHLGLRPGTSHTWEDDVFGTVTLRIQPGAEAEIPKLHQAENAAASGSPDKRTTTTWHGWSIAAPPPAIAPFNADRAKQHQEAWADYFGLPVEYSNSIGMKFRLIPPGEFLMGGPPEEIEAALKVVSAPAVRANIESEGPQHQVVLTKPTYLGVTEVTQSQYEQVMGINPSCFSATGRGKDAVANLETGNHPVESVSWYDAADFCVKLSQQEQLKPFYSRSDETVTYLEGTGYRLPTEAEWEYACRAGTTTPFWSGAQVPNLIQAGRFLSNSGDRTHSVGELNANPFGLSDLHGNAWEWCQYRFGDYPRGPDTDPRGPLSGEGVQRGGSWKDPSLYCRSASRLRVSPASQFSNNGFRVALTVDAVKGLLGKTSENQPPPAIAPFDESQAQAHQQVWEKDLDLPVEYTNSIGMKFRPIPRVIF
ncbi:MAG: SUMF1/EgtB/PvdO family nonheme iron enzyme [Planctomycetaceae bacterium]|nr:SUMF1/EgtB/PvdO family nonheme iron enzyme [Planctomycetaceae bacterium]